MSRVLVATKRTQGQRANDFSWTQDGEMVWVGTQCDGGYADDRCGCRRSLSGVVTAMSTTTVEVTEIEVGVEAWITLVQEAISRGFHMNMPIDVIEQDMAELIAAAENNAPGTVLEYRDGEFYVRKERNNQ